MSCFEEHFWNLSIKVPLDSSLPPLVEAKYGGSDPINVDDEMVGRDDEVMVEKEEDIDPENQQEAPIDYTNYLGKELTLEERVEMNTQAYLELDENNFKLNSRMEDEIEKIERMQAKIEKLVREIHYLKKGVFAEDSDDDTDSDFEE